MKNSNIANFKNLNLTCKKHSRVKPTHREKKKIAIMPNCKKNLGKPQSESWHYSAISRCPFIQKFYCIWILNNKDVSIFQYRRKNWYNRYNFRMLFIIALRDEISSFHLVFGTKYFGSESGCGSTEIIFPSSYQVAYQWIFLWGSGRIAGILEIFEVWIGY